MAFCKDFLLNILKLTLEDVYLILDDDIIPNLFDYVYCLDQIKFEDGSYHIFYGEVKHLINGFLTYFDTTMDNVLREADKFSNVTNRTDLKFLVLKTINIHQARQIFFVQQFLAFNSASERETQGEIEANFEIFKEGLSELQITVEKLDKQDKVDKFATEHFLITLQKTNELFQFTHNFISIMLSKRLNETRVSLEEILLRIQNNLKKLQEDCDIFLKNIQNELYKKNKDIISLSRQPHKKSVDVAEVTYSIKALRYKIENHKYTHPIRRVTEEVRYWKCRLKDFNFIADNLSKLQMEQENVQKQQKIYNELRTTELPGSKSQCWENMGKNFKNRLEFLEVKILDVSKTLMTFFAIPGYDHVVGTDHIGTFYLDSYNHQVYVFNHELEFCHVDCDGKFQQVSDSVKYYFDLNGRFILGENGEKIYQCAPCVSSYKLDEDHLLNKITEDCGHSNDYKKECRKQVKTVQSNAVILPDAKEINMKGTLSTEVVEYLWKNFGHLLPEALHDVGLQQPRNPIQYFAHKLLLHRYSRTFSELWKKKKEADEYRSNIFKERKKKAVMASKAWKAKQIKRRKPEESDDIEQQAVYAAYIAAQEQIAFMYDDD